MEVCLEKPGAIPPTNGMAPGFLAEWRGVFWIRRLIDRHLRIGFAKVMLWSVGRRCHPTGSESLLTGAVDAALPWRATGAAATAVIEIRVGVDAGASAVGEAVVADDKAYRVVTESGSIGCRRTDVAAGPTVVWVGGQIGADGSTQRLAGRTWSALAVGTEPRGADVAARAAVVGV